MRSLKVLTLETNRPRVLILANQHAREWMTMSVAMKLAQYLVSNYDTDFDVKALVDTRETWIVPCLNEDGYIQDTGDAVEPNPPGAFWRKNMRDNDQTDGSFTSGWDGADLNRNFGYQWEGFGSSPNPGTDNYRGPWAFSEPETQAIRDLMRNRPFLLGLSLHTYSNLVLYPWGYTPAPAPDVSLLQSMAAAMATGYQWGGKLYTGNGYTAQQACQLYPTNGDAGDWAYGFLGIPFFTFEMTPNTFYEPASQIAPTFNLNKDAMLYLIRRAPEITGAVRGAVTDPNGVSLPASVAISATNRTPNEPDPKTGNYCWTMVPGEYSLTVSCTGYQTKTETVNVMAGAYTRQDFTLQPIATYTLSGQVRDEAGHALPAFLRLNNTQRGSFSANPNDGSYRVSGLVPGKYQIQVWANGYQARWVDLNLTGDQNTDIVLHDPSPLLVVNDDGWGQAGNQLSLYQDSLARLGYASDPWETLARGLPTILELKNYAQVIWLKPYGGLLPEVQDLLQNYLMAGGRLILSGQDIALSADLQGDFLGSVFSSDLASDDVDTRTLLGIAGDPIGDGLRLDLNALGGMRDNAYCDSLTTTNSLACFLYEIGGNPAGAARVEKSDYRAVFFAFNWEGISLAAQRDTVLDRALAWNDALPNDPPTITSQPPQTATVYSSYTYTVTATDEQGDPLDYSLIFFPQGMDISDSGVVTWTPTEGQAGAQAVKLSVRDPRGGKTAQAFTLTVTLGSLSAYSQTTAAGWNLVTLSLATELPPAQLFGPSFQMIYFWDPLNACYLAPGTLSVGQGYWVKMSAAATIFVYGSLVPSPCLFPLANGWNMIGDPFPIPLSWSQLSLVRGAQELSIEEAQNAGWIGTVCSWNGSSYFLPDLATGTLSPGQGFWLKALQTGISLKSVH